MSGGRRAAAVGAALACRLVLGVVASLGLLAVAPNAAGLPSTVVMSDSMAPGIRAGDVVVVRPVPAAATRIGQVVLVDDPDFPGRLRLHRLAGRRGADLVLRGDANPADDRAAVHPSALRGVGFLRVPWIGLPILWLRTGAWPLSAAAAAGIGVLALVVARLDDDVASDPTRLRVLARRVLRRAAAPGGGAAALVLLCVLAFGGGAAAATEPSWSVFSSGSSSPSDEVDSGAWTCPAVPSPAPDLWFSFMDSGSTSEANLGSAGSGYGVQLSTAAMRVPGTCTPGASPHVHFTGDGSRAITGSSYVPVNIPATETFWFAPTADAGVISSFGSPSGPDPGSTDRQVYFTSTGSLAAAMRDGGGVSSCAIPGAVSTGTWHFAAVVFDGSTLTLDLDGTTSTCSTAVASPSSGYAVLRYGSDPPLAADAAAGSFSGDLDEVGAWARVLSATDLASVQSAGH